MKIVTIVRTLFARRQLPDTPARRAESGPTFECISIAKDGSKQSLLVGTTSYGKGHVPLGGHKPSTVVEYLEDQN